MDKHLHIVTHDVPWPVDFGGVVDLFYKIKSLHQLGIKIHLHCFVNERPEQPILNRYCETVNYYQRKTGRASFSLTIPYIVSSRRDQQLIKNLQKDDYPVFLEGVHCTYFLYKGLLKNRKVFVRLHNVEYRYYRQLAGIETNFLKKGYFLAESFLLKRYEKAIARKAVFWPVSEEDTALYRKEFHADRIDYLPVFLPWNELKTVTGSGSFCLYHGNLEINENEKAAVWLLSHVFNTLNIPFVVAGKNPSSSLQELAHKHPHTCIVVNPSEHEMQDMIRKAQINILPSFNITGVKLKLLNALYNGRHCLINSAAAAGSGLEDLCVIAHDENSFREEIQRLYHEPFSEKDMQHRSAALLNRYNNEKNARQLIAWIY